MCNGWIKPATVALNSDDSTPTNKAFQTVDSARISLLLTAGAAVCMIAIDEKFAKLARLNVASCRARADIVVNSCSCLKATNSLKTSLTAINLATAKLSAHGTPIIKATGVKIYAECKV